MVNKTPRKPYTKKAVAPKVSPEVVAADSSAIAPVSAPAEIVGNAPAELPPEDQRPEEIKPAGTKAVEKAGIFVLTKNHGLLVGHDHKFYAAGTELIPGKDDAVIHALAQNGAILEEK